MKNVRLQKFMRGVISSWSCVDPLGEGRVLYNTSLIHKNTVNNVLLLAGATRSQVYKALLDFSYKWRITIDMEFDSGLEIYIVPRVIVYHGAIHDGDVTWSNVVEDLFDGANMNHYVTTHITAEILDGSPIKEADFLV
jgi:hypothetical protein